MDLMRCNLEIFFIKKVNLKINKEKQRIKNLKNIQLLIKN